MPFLADPSDARSLAEATPAALLDSARIARVVRDRGVLRLGLLPADGRVAVPPVAVQLARALAELTAAPVGVVDADGSWVGTPGTERTDPAAGAGASAPSWIAPRVALLSLGRFGPGTALDHLRELVSDPTALGRLVVDLTGFDRLGEHLGACELMDGLVLLARSGETLTRDLSRAARDLPEDRFLGVLLVGA